MRQAIFNYPAEFTTLPDYSAHRGQRVQVVRELIDGVDYDLEDGDTMFLIRADDGWEGHAFASELQEC